MGGAVFLPQQSECKPRFLQFLEVRPQERKGMGCLPPQGRSRRLSGSLAVIQTLFFNVLPVPNQAPSSLSPAEPGRT